MKVGLWQHDCQMQHYMFTGRAHSLHNVALVTFGAYGLTTVMFTYQHKVNHDDFSFSLAFTVFRWIHANILNAEPPMIHNSIYTCV